MSASSPFAESGYRLFLESAPEALVICSAANEIVLVNRRTEQLFGYAREELVGQRVGMLVPERFRGHYLGENLDFIIASRRPRAEPGQRLYGLRKGGEEFAVEISSNRLELPNGIMSIFAVRDISERMRAEEQVQTDLRELSDFKAALDEHAILATTDPHGRITYANDKFCEISKYSREELLGQDHRILNSGYHSKEFMREMWTTIRSGKVWKGEIRNRAKDGTYYWVHATIVPLTNREGHLTQYVAIRTEITARKQAEEELERTVRQMERALAEVNTLRGLLPICASCKKIRDKSGEWNPIESYISEHSRASFTHGYCPECSARLIRDLENAPPVPRGLAIKRQGPK